jgi:hypothetical protein
MVEAGQMAGKPTGRKREKATGERTVKVTLRLKLSTAQRLGTGASIRRVTMSAIAEAALVPYVRQWAFPPGSDRTEDAA